MAARRKAPKNVCGAKTRKDGGPCQVTALMANGRCKVHAGCTPVGTESPHFKTGRYSKLLPTQFAKHYAEAQNDKELLALKDEVMLTDSQIRARLEALTNDHDSQGFRMQALATFAAVVKALDAADEAKLRDAMKVHGALLTMGADEFEAMAEVNGLVGARARLVEMERGHHLRQQAAVTLDEMRVLMAAIYDAIRKHVPDGEQVARIALEIQRMVGGELDAEHAAN